MRKPVYWCVAEISKDGKINPISPSFEYVVDAEERMDELLKTEKYKGKNLQVVEASYPVDPRKPPRRRKR
jgi:hypothetical protein